MLHRSMAVPAVGVLTALLVSALQAPAQNPGPDNRPGYYTEDYTGPGDKGESQQGLVARFRVRVPARAELWFDGQKTKQKGPVREFVTEKLDPDRIYPYRVRARWVEDGITVEKTLRVRAIAGNRVTINFVRPPRTVAPVLARIVPAPPPPVEPPPASWRAPVP